MEQTGKRTIQQVLSMLENAGGGFVSGAGMAKDIGVSRTAIWKAITELRNQGYLIESVTNKGYRLSEQNDILSEEGIRSLADPALWEDSAALLVYDCVDSTNDRAKQLAMGEGTHGTCIVAARQEGGRGRKDHLFFSPDGGIYMSVILRPDRIPFTNSDAITAYIGASVCEVIEELTGRKAGIRGINDLYLDGKKICGILIESGSEFDSGTLQWIVVGIGINFDSDVSRFPKELREKAASLFSPGKASISKNRLVAAIIERISRMETADEKSAKNAYERWREMDC